MINSLVQEIEIRGGAHAINVLDWTSKATYVSATATWSRDWSIAKDWTLLVGLSVKYRFCGDLSVHLWFLKQIFLHDFEGGNSPDAQRILTARKQGVSAIARYAGFLAGISKFPLSIPLKTSMLDTHASSTVPLVEWPSHLGHPGTEYS